MGYRRANGLILVSIAFLLCAFVAFLLYRKNFFVMPDTNVMIPLESARENSAPSAPEVFVSSTPIQKTNKVLKNFGSCGDESKNDSILSYSPDLLNALLDTINDSYCEAPKVGFPNYSFVLQDPSAVRIAEMTPDYKYIFYLKVETSDTSSTYSLYKTDIASRQTALLETYVISSDWPLQKDFYEDKLMPRESLDGKKLQYFWFLSDPKGRSDTSQYLEQKEISLE